MDRSKKDWKLFREKLSGWQENYMTGLVKEYVDFLNDDTRQASEKFWKLEKRIREDKRLRNGDCHGDEIIRIQRRIAAGSRKNT